MSNYHYIFFDLDGTLLDSKPDILACVRYALTQRGHAVPPQAVLDKFIGPPMQDSLVRYCGLPMEEALRCVDLFREHYAVLEDPKGTVTPGILETCRRLKARGCVLTLSSSKPQELCDAFCRQYGFDCFSAVVGSPRGGDLGKLEIIRETFRQLGLTEDDRPAALMVGDRDLDVLGAKAFGIDCVGAAFFDYAIPDELAASGAVAVIRTAAELEDFLGLC